MAEINHIDATKRECLLCITYKSFQPSRSDACRLKVQQRLTELADFYRDKFNELRKGDADVADIKLASYNKSVCLDALNVCQGCRKEFDAAGRELIKLK